MTPHLALALLAAVLVAPARGEEPAPRAELIERILAVVDDRPLFLSEVKTLGAVRQLEGQAALDAAIDQRLMYAEAARLPQADVSDDEVEAALGRLLAQRPGLRSQAELAELRRLLRRQATIVKYVEFRFRPQIRITAAEIRRAWEGEHGREEAGFAEAEPQLRERLARRALDERIEEWVKDLRARADVRYVPGDGEDPVAES
jgi:hypothetical protein